MIAGSQMGLLGKRDVMRSSLNTLLESTTDHGTDSSQYWAIEVFAISPVNVRFLTVLAVIALHNLKLWKIQKHPQSIRYQPSRALYGAYNEYTG